MSVRYRRNSRLLSYNDRGLSIHLASTNTQLLDIGNLRNTLDHYPFLFQWVFDCLTGSVSFWRTRWSSTFSVARLFSESSQRVVYSLLPKATKCLETIQNAQLRSDLYNLNKTGELINSWPTAIIETQSMMVFSNRESSVGEPPLLCVLIKLTVPG